MRHCEIMLEYLGKDVTADILPFFQSLTYDENAEGLTDQLSLSLTNTDRRWFDAWLPKTGDEIHATIVSHDWNYPGEVLTLDLQNMVVDDPEFSGPPDILTLKALNVPAAKNFTDLPLDTTWQDISMRELAQEIADRYGLSLQFDTQDFTIHSLKRSKQSDAGLLNATAQKYNLCLKVYSRKIVIYSKHAYEQLPPVCTITQGVSSIEHYVLQNPLIGTGYDGCTILYKSVKSKELIKFTYPPGAIGRVMVFQVAVDSPAQAEQVAMARLRQANEKQFPTTFDLALNLNIVAGCTVMLQGWGPNFDGMHFVESASHLYGKSAGMTSIKTHKCLQGGY